MLRHSGFCINLLFFVIERINHLAELVVINVDLIEVKNTTTQRRLGLPLGLTTLCNVGLNSLVKAMACKP